MAITKIKPIKSTLKQALDYIQNPEKTDEKMLVSSFGCSYETADIEFGFTISQALDKGNNLAHHLIQSFEPGEVDFQAAHEIGRQLADAVTKGQHEYVLTTHIDKGHVHNHIIFCAVNFVDHHKYVSNKRSYYGIRNISDRLCREHGLSVVVPEKGRKGKSYIEYQAEKAETSWKGKLKIAVDSLIPQVSDFEELLSRLQAAGYEVKRGKYISCRAPEQERFTRLKTLGPDYTEEAIKERITGTRSRSAKAPRQDHGGVSLLIDIENSIKAQQSAGYEHWAKIHNLKQAARTMNFLTEHKIEQYTELTAKIAEITTASEQAAEELKGVERRLADMAVLIKNITTYQKTRPVYAASRRAGDPAKYRAEHESSLILYEAAAKALKASGITKLPDVAALQAEYAKLKAQKEALYADYGKLKKQIKEYGIIKKNIDSILPRRQEQEREKVSVRE
ncbi:relaxase/mobilization nuclease domain-containing protein [Ruthenibacterium lactatiformans]|uniref:relaxase/mobilization nuclease domain-containing protein n=1 Tax=Ruthenibacterium lactatiformans TaxID=1550024 RepID=UPI00210AE720|nr:relaxase/mobilization nuclease domain-containing protein [Ruthenibacterium lactatiformans]MCQ5089467.1 relaxase/mobilization nuclease domain-containing protein [Ruthenibacterium lactatiformans]